jgi:hypothetical protein
LVSNQSFRKHSNLWKEIMEYTKIGAAMFDGYNYTFWNKMMKTFLHAHEYGV